MRKFMRKLFEKNITLKIVSLILAVFVWVYIMIVLDPPVERVVQVPIQLINHLSLDDLGYGIISESANSTSVRVQGTRTVISRLTANDIIATVNLAYIDAVGTRSLPVNISILVNNVTVLGSNPLAVNITVDEIITAQLEVQVAATGSLSNNFVVGEISIEPYFVDVAGPSTIINDLVATAPLSLNGRTVDVSEIAEINFTSISGREIPNSLLAFDVTHAVVNAQILAVRSVSVAPNLSEYFLSQIEAGAYTLSVSPATVEIVGRSAALAGVTELSTTLMQNVVNVANGSRGTANLILPSGVSLRDDAREVTISLTRVQTANTPVDEPEPLVEPEPDEPPEQLPEQPPEEIENNDDEEEEL